MNKNYDISVLVPIYNEEKSILILYNELKKNLNNTFIWEIILLNDGSTDSSYSIITDLVKKNSNVKLFLNSS